MKNIFVIVLALTVVSIFSNVVFAKTYTVPEKRLTVITDNYEEVKMASEAIDYAYRFFAKAGYTEKTDITITFKNKVYVDMGNDVKVRIYGLFNKADNSIVITSMDDVWLTKRKAFNLPVTNELHRSVITHEMSHLLANFYAGGLDGHGVHEYIAYVSQIDSLPEDVRKAVINEFKNDHFDCDDQINAMIHGIKPHSFGVMSYKHYLKTNGSFIKKIINKEFNPDDQFDLPMF